MKHERRVIWIGFDRREAAAFSVARFSARRRLTQLLPIQGLELSHLQQIGEYDRPMTWRGNVRWDVISDAPMSTEFALTRFLVPRLMGFDGWAVFMDSDMLVRGSLARLFDLGDRTKAVQVVKHEHRPAADVKMDGQPQTSYPRKNWSSVMLFNCAHPSNQKLTRRFVNEAKGLALHQFCWLDDNEIGELPPEWNWLVGHSPPVVDPQIVHFTDGYPLMPGYEHQPFAADWEAELRLWANAPE